MPFKAIAKAIAEQLHAKLSPTEKSAIELPPTGDINAFDLYTNAKNSYLIGFGGSSGIALLEQAADLLRVSINTFARARTTEAARGIKQKGRKTRITGMAPATINTSGSRLEDGSEGRPVAPE